MSAIVYWIFLNSSSSLLVSHPGAWKESSAKPLSIYNIKKDNVKYKTLNLNKMKKNNTKKTQNKTKQELNLNLVPQCQTVNWRILHYLYYSRFAEFNKNELS